MKKMGRPASDTDQLNLRLSAAMIAKIDALRRNEQDLPTRPEMIRRLLQAKLDEIFDQDE
jgi:hypothetical protein